MSQSHNFKYRDILLIPELLSRPALQEYHKSQANGDPVERVKQLEAIYYSLVEKGRNIVTAHFEEVPEEEKCTRLNPPPCPWPKRSDMHRISINSFKDSIITLIDDPKSYYIMVSEIGNNSPILDYNFIRTGEIFTEYYVDNDRRVDVKDEISALMKIVESEDGVVAEYDYYFTLLP